jgi:hypothetical protein
VFRFEVPPSIGREIFSQWQFSDFTVSIGRDLARSWIWQQAILSASKAIVCSGAGKGMRAVCFDDLNSDSRWLYIPNVLFSCHMSEICPCSAGPKRHLEERHDVEPPLNFVKGKAVVRLNSCYLPSHKPTFSERRSISREVNSSFCHFPHGSRERDPKNRDSKVIGTCWP